MLRGRRVRIAVVALRNYSPVMYMGAGILPTTIHKGKLWFLFGKENQFEQSAPGFSDFGGGNDNSESQFETAIREGGEELTGFLGTDDQLRKALKRSGTFNIDGSGSYRTHIFPMEYDPHLVKYYNNNQQFLQKHLDPDVIKTAKIFEKAEIQWVSFDELKRMRPKFRHFYVEVVDQIIAKRADIERFIRKSRPNTGTRKNLRR